MVFGADLVLTGGFVYTVDAARRVAAAVAVRGGRVAAVGSVREIASLVGPQTRVVELEGAMVLPGFQDAHLHPVEGGLGDMRCNLRGGDRAAYRTRVLEFVGANPNSEWVVGSGWSLPEFPGGIPSRFELDELVPDRPVYLTSQGGHEAWVNTRALELAGVTRDTPDPAGGIVVRDADGEPVGALQETAMALVSRLVPSPTPAERVQALRLAQQHLNRLGITAWHDASVRPEHEAAHMTLARAGELTGRARASLYFDPARGEEQIPELVERAREASGGPLVARTVKLFQDGVIGSRTAALIEAYEGTQEHGPSLIDPAALARYVTLLDAVGFQVHVHAIGDRAIRETLDAFEAARRANGPRDSRHQIAHVQLVDPADLARFRELGVIANVQPYWARNYGYVRDIEGPAVGRERGRCFYRFRRLLGSGATLAFGSDWPVDTADPLHLLEVAVTRVGPDDRSREPYLPEEALDLPAAIAAHTIGAAYANFLDHETGTIEPGKAADLVIVDRNLFAGEPGRIGDARVLATLVDGEAVYADDAVSGLADR